MECSRQRQPRSVAGKQFTHVTVYSKPLTNVTENKRNTAMLMLLLYWSLLHSVFIQQHVTIHEVHFGTLIEKKNRMLVKQSRIYSKLQVEYSFSHQFMFKLDWIWKSVFHPCSYMYTVPVYLWLVVLLEDLKHLLKVRHCTSVL
jgi:hypothetical protein